MWWAKRQILMSTQAIVGVAALILSVLVLTDLIQIWHMTLVAFMMGTAFAFNMPARQAYVQEYTHAVDITPWKHTRLFALLISLAAVLFYVFMAQ